MLSPSVDRVVGIGLAVVFVLVGLSPAMVAHQGPWLWALIVAGILLGIAVVVPTVLRPVTAVCGAMAYYALSPFAVMMRWLGADPLQVRRKPAARSYWRASARRD